ncbi:hypothetical protein TeGR_g2867 [Tetraparma gracilis]|uniref:N-acetyltransferase domain-containing protein n=1 Tax=Tetraparma gracilis TaxID=2962635 RepID=A0ABQ6N2C5_9STRA|nr:hypothetical protein TeGR_g2867 [Tetraparma gracilis]
MSDDYIRERLELDDPLTGHVCRHAASGAMQGFIVTTNFTTWRSSFQWDSLAPSAGITAADRRDRRCDSDGSLAKELGRIKSEGDPLTKGIVFRRVAELGLLGGLGCGSQLVARAIKHLEDSGGYDYIVLQATKMAIPFYEREGFVRVGAVAKFNDKEDMPLVAYRHWSDIVKNNAVEASYMMARRLGKKQRDHEAREGSKQMLSPRSEKKMREKIMETEKEQAIENTHKLAAEAIKTDTSTTEGSNTFKELCQLAKDAAADGGHRATARVIEQALSLYRNSSASYAALQAKRMICDHTGIDGGEEIEAMKRREEEAMFRKIRVSVVVDDEEIENEGYEPPARDKKRAGSSSATTTSSSSSSSSSSATSSSTARRALSITAPPLLPAPNQDDHVSKICLVSVNSRIGAASAAAANNGTPLHNNHSTRGGTNGLIHDHENEALGWLNGPFRRNLGVRVVVEGRDIRGSKDTYHEKLGSASRRKAPATPSTFPSTPKPPPSLSAIYVTPHDNVPPRHAAAYALNALSMQLMSPATDSLVVGDVVMINGLSTTGGWMEAVIERRVRKHEIPEDPSATAANSFVVKLSDNSRTAVVLANSESDKKTSARGVGRVWCTWRDWSAFSVLPVGLLEEILVGQTFELYTVLGAVRRGTVVGREGGGLHGPVKWKLLISVNDETIMGSMETRHLKSWIKLDNNAYGRLLAWYDREKKRGGGLFELSKYQIACVSSYEVTTSSGTGDVRGTVQEIGVPGSPKAKMMTQRVHPELSVSQGTSAFLYGGAGVPAARAKVLPKAAPPAQVPAPLRTDHKVTGKRKAKREVIVIDEEESEEEGSEEDSEEEVEEGDEDFEDPDADDSSEDESERERVRPTRNQKKKEDPPPSPPRLKSTATGKRKGPKPSATGKRKGKKVAPPPPPPPPKAQPKPPRAAPATPKKVAPPPPPPKAQPKPPRAAPATPKSKKKAPASPPPKPPSSPHVLTKKGEQQLLANVAKFTGVYRAGNKYCAKISRDGKLVHLGTYEKAVDAARAFDAYVIAKKMEVELNFPRSVRGSKRQRSV